MPTTPDPDDRLDALLVAAAPPTTPDTHDLRHTLGVMAAEVGHRPGRRRLTLVAATGVAVLGLGTAASAAGLLPGWQLLPTRGGQTCEVAVLASARESPPARFSPSEQARTLEVAQAYLATLDFDAVDRGAAIEAFQREEDVAISSQADPAERQPRLTGDDLEVSAVFRSVTEDLRAHLAAGGMELEAVEVSWLADGCDL